MIADESYNRLLDYLRDFLAEWRRDSQEARFFRMVELGIVHGYSPEALADYCKRFQRASKNDFDRMIPMSEDRMLKAGGNGRRRRP